MGNERMSDLDKTALAKAIEKALQSKNVRAQMPDYKRTVEGVLAHFASFDTKATARAMFDLLEVADKWLKHASEGVPDKPSDDPEVVAYILAANELRNAVFESRGTLKERFGRNA